jgi:hypothetical protein
MTTGRFDTIASVRAKKARREDEAARERTAASNTRVRKMKTKDAWETRRMLAGLPAGATKGEIISAESQIEFLDKAASGDAAQLESLGFGKKDKEGTFVWDIFKLNQSLIDMANAPLFPERTIPVTGKKEGRVEGAYGPPFIDYRNLPGPGEITQEMWDKMGHTGSKVDAAKKKQLDAGVEDIKAGAAGPGLGGDIIDELHAEEKGRRDERFAGGPGWYVEKAAWQTAYAQAELKRLQRPKYKIVSGGRKVEIGGSHDMKSKAGREAARERATARRKAENTRVLEAKDPSQLKPAAQKRRARLLAGQERAKPKNAKRLAGINKIRAKHNLDAIVNVNDWGVPVVGWRVASDWATAIQERDSKASAAAVRAQPGEDLTAGAFRMNRGGYMRGYNTGGNVDSVKALLTPGEFVMRRDSVRKYGERFMNDINLQKLQAGGAVGATPAQGRPAVSQSKDLERGAALAGESILNAFSQGSQMVGDAIREALAPENLAAQIGDVVGQKMQESLAATSLEMRGNMGVDVRLSGNGAAADMTNAVQGKIKASIVNAFNSVTNHDGSSKDPSLHQPPTQNNL